MTSKARASKAMSRYIRLRDALDYCQEHGIDLSQFSRPEDIIGACVTCGAVKSWIRMDCGHYKSRGSGGRSGAYFLESNVGLQCKRCNAFEGGRPKEFAEHIKTKYGQDELDYIEKKHYLPTDMRAAAMEAMAIYFNSKYKELTKKNKL